jgi:hypothetical protein
MTTTCGGQLVVDPGAGVRLVLLDEVVHREVHALEVAPRDRQVTRHRGAGGDHDRVVARLQVVPGDVAADLDARTEAGALGLHLGEARVDLALLHLEVGDPVAEQPADAVVALVHGDGVPGARELLRGGEPGGAGPHDGDGLARQTLRRVGGDPTVLERVVDDRDLDLLDRHRRLVDAEHARGLARGGAQPARELREVVRRVQPLDGLPALTAPGEVVPLRDQVAEGAALVAERHATVHAATGLALEGAGLLLLVDLFPVHEPDGHGSPCRELAFLDLEESLGVSHRSPP